MADSDKDILITPNVSQTSQPEIKFVGKDNSPVYLKVLDDNTLSFEGTEGQVFSIGPVLSSGTIFSVNDISGIPSITVDADGTIKIIPNGTNPSSNLYVGDLRHCFVYARGTGNNNAANSLVYVNGDKIVDSATRGLNLTIINQVDLSVVSSTNYDTYANQTNNDNLATAIGNMTDQQIGILVSEDAWENTNTSSTANLVAAAKLVGLTKLGNIGNMNSTNRRPYAAIFMGSGDDANAANKFVIERMSDADADAPMASVSAILVSDGTHASIMGSNNVNAIWGADSNHEEPALIADEDNNIDILGGSGGNGNLNVSRTSGSTVFLQAQSATGVIGTSTNHELSIKTNDTTRLHIENSGEVLIGATSMGDTESKVGISGKLRVGDIANTQDGSARAYLHVDSGSEDPGGTSGDFVRLSTLMMDGGSGGNNVMYTTYALRNNTGTTWTSLSIVDGIRVDTTAEVLKANGVTGSNLRMWHEIDPMDAKRHWGHIDTIGMTYHQTGSGRLGIGTTSPVSELDLSTGALSFANTNSQLKLTGGSNVDLQLSHWANAHVIIDSDGNDTNRYFSVRHGNTTAGSATELFRVQEDGEIRFNDAYTFPTADGSANQVLQTDGSGNLSFATVSGGGSTSPAGSDSQVQYNNGGSFGGDADFTWDDTNNRLVIGSITSQHDGLGKLTVKGTDASFLLEKHDDSASGGPTMTLYRYSASVADGDLIGQVNFRGEGSTGNPSTYMSLRTEIVDTTEGTKDAKLIMRGLQGNTQTDFMEVGQKVQIGPESVNPSGITTGKVTISRDSTDETTDGPTLMLVDGDDDSSPGPVIKLYRNTASPADNDVIGQILFSGEDSVGGERTYGSISARTLDVSSGTRDSEILLKSTKDGADVTTLTLYRGEVKANLHVETYKPAVFMDSGNINVTTTEVTIPFDTEILDPAGNATLATGLGEDGHIRLVAGGYYRISYSIPINDDSTAAADRTRVFVDMQTSSSSAFSSFTTVAQSRAQVYTRENSGGSGLSTSFIYEHTANDYIRLRIDAQLGTDISTETNECQISIEYLGPA